MSTLPKARISKVTIIVEDENTRYVMDVPNAEDLVISYEALDPGPEISTTRHSVSVLDKIKIEFKPLEDPDTQIAYTVNTTDSYKTGETEARRQRLLGDVH